MCVSETQISLQYVCVCVCVYVDSFTVICT